MPSSRPFLVDLTRVACEGPEAVLLATPLTSHASTFWLSPSADSQTRNSRAAGLFGPTVAGRTVNLGTPLRSRSPVD